MLKTSLNKFLDDYDARKKRDDSGARRRQIPILAESFFREGSALGSPLRYAVFQRYEIELGGHCIAALRCSQRQLDVPTDIFISVNSDDGRIFWRSRHKPQDDFVVLTSKVLPIKVTAFSDLLFLGRVLDRDLVSRLVPQQVLAGSDI